MTEGGALAGRVAIVTGSSQGLGKEIARAYLGAGARVLICARGERELDEAARELSAGPGCADRCASVVADVSLKADVDRIVAEGLHRFGKIDILVNNAGIQGPIGLVDEIDWDGWSAVVRVNLFGSVLMARAVIPQFRSRRRGKIIQLSGGGATGPRYGFSAYAASKTAVVRFAENLATELREFNIDVNSIAPGALNTRMLDEMLEVGPECAGRSAFDAAQQQRIRGGTPLAIPVRLAVFLASAASDGITGKLISAVWDNWEMFPEHKNELSNSDVYTLRRILGKDRGFGWGDK